MHFSLTHLPCWLRKSCQILSVYIVQTKLPYYEINILYPYVFFSKKVTINIQNLENVTKNTNVSFETESCVIRLYGSVLVNSSWIIWQSFFVYYWKEFTKISNGLQIYSFFKILNVYVALKDQNSKKEFCRQLSQNYCSETIGNDDHMSTNIYWLQL